MTLRSCSILFGAAVLMMAALFAASAPPSSAQALVDPEPSEVGGDVTVSTITSSPRLLPDSPFYILKTLWEGVAFLPTLFDAANRASYYLELAERRLSEALALSAAGKADLVSKLVGKSAQLVQKATSQLLSLDQGDINRQVVELELERFLNQQQGTLSLISQTLLTSAQKTASDVDALGQDFIKRAANKVEEYGQQGRPVPQKDVVDFLEEGGKRQRFISPLASPSAIPN